MAAPQPHENPFRSHTGVERSHPHTQSTIPEALDEVLDLFDKFQGQQAVAQHVARAIEDSVARVRVWAGNIGAFHASDDRRSAAFRLRSAPAVSRRIVELLEQINRDCRELLSILRGDRADASQETAVEYLDEDDMALLEAMDEPESEAQELADGIVETITSLFRVSILLRRATPRDRYSRAKATIQSPLFPAFAVYDRRHVAEKFPKVEKDPAIRDRLGNAITERRRFLQYARDHHARIASSKPVEGKVSSHQLHVPEITNARTDDTGTVSERPSRIATDASTLYPVTGANALSDTVQDLDAIEDDDDAYSQATSRTSFFDLTAKDGRLQVIPLQDVCDDGHPFECPYCWQIVVFKRNSAWRKHVLRDLRAYTCTFANCTIGLFEHREDWFKHELETHRRTWSCPACTEMSKSFATASLLQEHLQTKHSFSTDGFEAASVPDGCSQPVIQMPAASACPLCDEYDAAGVERNGGVLMIATPEIKKHLADHLEQLALFAIMPSNDDGENTASRVEDAEKGSMSGQPDGLSGQDLSEVSIDDGDTPLSLVQGASVQQHQIPERDSSDGSSEPSDPPHKLQERVKWDPTDDVQDTSKDQDRNQGELLAKKYFRDGRWNEAQEVFENLTRTALALGGEKDAHTLTNMFWLAETYTNQGVWEKAIELHNEVLQSRMKLLGPSHSDTLESIDALGQVYLASKQPVEAESLLKMLISSNERRFGKEHYNIVWSKEDLATCYNMAGRINDAIRQREENMPMLRNILGPGHISTLQSMYRLSVDYRLTGRLSEAVEMGEEVLQGNKKAWGPDHQKTLSTMQHLSACHRSTDRVGEALAIDEEVFKASKKSFGLEHPYTLSAMRNLFTDYELSGRSEEAGLLIEEVLVISKRIWDPDTAAALATVASNYMNLGRYQEAIELRESILVTMEKTHGHSHRETLLALHDLAHALVLAGRSVEALPITQKAFDMRKQTLGLSHPDTLTSMHILSTVLQNVGRLDEGLSTRESVLQLKTDALGRSHGDTLASMGALAWDYNEIGQRAKALEIMKEAVILSTEDQGPRHPSTVQFIEWLDELTLRNQEAEGRTEDTNPDPAQSLV